MWLPAASLLAHPLGLSGITDPATGEIEAPTSESAAAAAAFNGLFPSKQHLTARALLEIGGTAVGAWGLVGSVARTTSRDACLECDMVTGLHEPQTYATERQDQEQACL